MKKIFMTPSVKEFEEFVNKTGINIISVDVKCVEQSYYFQERFAGLIYYELLEPNPLPNQTNDKE